MTTEPSNPFHGRTLRVARPSADHAEFRACSEQELGVAQAEWDSAEAARLQEAAEETDRAELLVRYETREEPAAKAIENRARVAFLSTKGATMKMWLEQRDAILGGATDE